MSKKTANPAETNRRCTRSTTDPTQGDAMKTQLKIATTAALTLLGFAGTMPVQAFPSAAEEYSKLTYTAPTKAATQRVVTAATTRTSTSPFPSAAMEP
jgi:hypothetical protein